MRAAPALTSSAYGTFGWYDDQGAVRTTSAVNLDYSSNYGCRVYVTISGATTGAGRARRFSTEACFIMADARIGV